MLTYFMDLYPLPYNFVISSLFDLNLSYILLWAIWNSASITQGEDWKDYQGCSLFPSHSTQKEIPSLAQWSQEEDEIRMDQR